MHRGERIVLAIASPGPDLVGVIACDDTGMTCGFNPLASDTRAVAALLGLAANDAEAREGSGLAPSRSLET
jgi:hypothetical protein